MKCSCRFDMTIALKKHSQSLKTTLEEARTAGLKLNKQADKQGMTIFLSPKLSAAIGGLSRSIGVTQGASEGNAEHSIQHFMEEKSFMKKILMAKCSVWKNNTRCLPH